MSATIYGVLQWCDLESKEITDIVNKILVGNIYKGEDFYHKVERLGKWRPANEEDDSVIVWSADDAGPITIDGKEIGLFVHFDEDKGVYDWACTYELC